MVTRGSGNVFRDLGLADADVLQAKADLVFKISSIIEKRGLSQVEAAQILGVTQPKVSALLRGHLDGFSLERIMRFLAALDQRIEIKVRPKTRRARAVEIA
ncbi:MAG: helix-turn-helix transcriptional regulator [Candidatus Binatus sp.]